MSASRFAMSQDTYGCQPCEEKRRLFFAYQEAALTYSQLVRQLAEAAASAMNTEYDFISQRVKRARTMAVQARERLNSHKSDHNC